MGQCSRMSVCPLMASVLYSSFDHSCKSNEYITSAMTFDNEFFHQPDAWKNNRNQVLPGFRILAEWTLEDWSTEHKICSNWRCHRPKSHQPKKLLTKQSTFFPEIAPRTSEARVAVCSFVNNIRTDRNNFDEKLMKIGTYSSLSKPNTNSLALWYRRIQSN